MGIGVVVRSERREPLLGLLDVRQMVPPPEPLDVYVPLIRTSDATAFPLLAGICPYEDTIFNSWHSRALLGKLDRVEAHGAWTP